MDQHTWPTLQSQPPEGCVHPQSEQVQEVRDLCAAGGKHGVPGGRWREACEWGSAVLLSHLSHVGLATIRKA